MDCNISTALLYTLPVYGFRVKLHQVWVKVASKMRNRVFVYTVFTYGLLDKHHALIYGVWAYSEIAWREC